MSLLVIGSGAWGTALAVSAARSQPVCLWSRDETQVRDLQARRVNQRYLPQMRLPDSLQVVGGPLSEWAARASLVVIASPVAGLRSTLNALRDVPPISAGQTPVVWLCKGFEPAQGEGQHGLMPHEVQAQCAPQLRCGALSGPSFAQEVAQGLPAALVAASRHADVRAALVQAFHGPTLRVYDCDDIVGVEVGGAVKNVLAIATGLCDGLALGANARAALVTRGLAEMVRLGVALGARAETFMGLSGLGDLVLTTTGDLSRNRQVGLALARGQSLAEALSSLGHVAEGVQCARTVWSRAQALSVDMPICACVVDLLDGRLSAQQAVAKLMGREARPERLV